MDKISQQVDIKEMGKRFTLIRKRLGMTQKEASKHFEKNLTQTKVSFIECGHDVFSSNFLTVVMFYLQYVSADKLFAQDFDPDDPELFDKEYKGLAGYGRLEE
ncbi:MAG TPA: hypothetical protein DIS88_05315 [Prevotella sp.]|nr:hypothetical protein [Prevotella sp.]